MADRTSSRREGVSRRGFVAGSAVGLGLLPARRVFTYQANEKISLGIIGAGGRGQWIAKLFAQHGGYQIVAVADYFQDRVDSLGNAFQVPENRRHTGLKGYQRLLEQKPDAVAIETPSYFHPEQSLAAVDAGAHVFLAKPVAVDVPGCLDILRAGQRARQKKLCFLVDFQTRANPLYQETVRRVHAGDIGRVVCAEARYYTGYDPAREETLARDPANKELQLRYWALVRVLSGDVITEQNIHALDVATWFLDAEPVKAYGTGGRKARGTGGDCWDHFAVIFHFPGDVVLSFSSKQLGTGYETIACRVFGTEGTADTDYWRAVSIAGRKPFQGGSVEGLYTTGAVANIATFAQAILQGDFSNPTVEPSVRSNLTTILGRMAAYRHGEVTWKEMMETAEKWEFDTSGLRA
jgi:predicted dehydrogenase